MNAPFRKPEVKIGYSACPHDCPSTCALEVELKDERTIGRVHGAEDNRYTAGVICAKVARYEERVHHPDRLRVPLQRIGAKGEGRFREITWEQALDEVAEAFQRKTAQYGSETVWPYYYAGTMGLVQRDGIHRLRHAMRYSGFLSTICVNLAWGGFIAGTGKLAGADPREMADADVVVIWGTNAVNTQVNVMTHATRARKERGAKIVVIDTYRNGTAEAADMHICVRPGTDGALACAVMHVLFRDGLADWDYLRKYTDCPDDLEAHLKTRTPAWASAISGVPVDQIEAFAKLVGENKKTYLRLGYGFSRQRNGAANMHAASCIAAVTGSWKYKGGGAFHNNGAIYHWDRSLIEGHSKRDPKIRMLDQSRFGPVLVGDKTDIGDGPPVTALLIQNTNPAQVTPEVDKAQRGMRRADLFACVHEQFMTDTAKLADIVLPATTFLEHDDIYQGGGHQYIQAGPKLIEPYAEARENHYVICELAKRLGAEHEGFHMTAAEIADWTLKASGWPGWEELKAKRWHDCQPDFETAHYLNGFAYPDGKFHFAPDWSMIGPQHKVMPRLPDHFAVIESATEECPFRMVTAPSRSFLNSSFNETPSSVKREKRPSLKVHPGDLARLGLANGQRIRIGNQRGSVVLHAEAFDGVQPSVVIHEGIWPNGAFEEGLGINVLVGADACPPNGGAAFHDTAIWIKAA